MTTSPATHDLGGAASVPSVRTARYGRRPSDADRARTLAAGATTLAIAALDHGGHPFASVVPFGLDETGQPVLWLSALAEHTRVALVGRARSFLDIAGRQ